MQPSPFSISFQPGDSIRPLLDSALTQVNAQGAYLYRFEQGGQTVRLTLWAGVDPGDIPAIEGAAATTHSARNSSVVLQDAAWNDWRFASLPEFRRHRFEGVISVPVLEGGAAIGMLNVCRTRSVPLKPAQLSFLLSLSPAIASLEAAAQANEALRAEVDKLERQLESRKLVERAKGLLQARNEWTEEQAYLHVRRLSRQRRTPMGDIAREIIDAA